MAAEEPAGVLQAPAGEEPCRAAEDIGDPAEEHTRPAEIGRPVREVAGVPAVHAFPEGGDIGLAEVLRAQGFAFSQKRLYGTGKVQAVAEAGR